MTSSVPHVSRLTQALRALLQAQRAAALGTRGDDGHPQVSMVPYAVLGGHGALVIHVSGLAAHTGNLQRHPQASLMVMQAETPDEPVHALPRVSFQVEAEELTATHPWHPLARQAYLARFPEAEPMTELPDFRWVVLHVRSARQIAGFGAARTVGSDDLRQALNG